MARRPSPTRLTGSLEVLRGLLNFRPFAAELWTDVLAEDCHIRICNEPPTVGRSRSIKALADFLNPTSGVGAQFWDAAAGGKALYVETDLWCDKKGKRCEIPCLLVLRPLNPPFKDLRFYLDPEPLHLFP